MSTLAKSARILFVLAAASVVLLGAGYFYFSWKIDEYYKAKSARPFSKVQAELEPNP